MRLNWTTDPHFNHVPLDRWESWVSENVERTADATLIGGDISEGDDVVFQLQRIVESVPRPTYFVLGNHDFYHTSIPLTRRRVIELCRDHPGLHYLTDCGPVDLAQGVVLLGEDGWGDGTVGDYDGSTVRLNDFERIQDFCESDPGLWKSMLQRHGRESAERFESKVDSIGKEVAVVVLLTHVPPFREACWYQGKTTDDNWAPFFVCGELGSAIRRAALRRPECQWIILCGHTHNRGTAQIAPNLVVYTGAADYGRPVIEGVLNVGDRRADVAINFQSD